MLYQEVASILDIVRNKKGAPKSLVLSSKCKNKKMLYALVCETMKYDEALTTIISSCKLQKQERALASESMAKVLVYDLLFGKGLQGKGKMQKAVLHHKTSLKAELARLKIKQKAIHNQDLLPDSVKLSNQMPRYVRVNLIKTTMEETIEVFRKDGFNHVFSKCKDSTSFLQAVKGLKPRQFVNDFHLPDVLVFPHGTDLHSHTLYLSGHVILQDKASCMPAFILAPPPGSHVIDCCAAPGNKTSHVASLMSNKGKIFSFDMDMKRLSTMSTLMFKAGVSCAELTNKDFLTVNPRDVKYRKVDHIIVDPSCSGSGIVGRQDVSVDSSESTKERLESLAKFQISILNHALSFPNVQRVVYSTCSIHEQENECVIQQVLASNNNDFGLVHVLPSWPHRGTGVFENSHRCLRFAPERDLTNGFFVACFQRGSQKNELSTYEQIEDGSTSVIPGQENGTSKKGIIGNTLSKVGSKTKRKRLKKKKLKNNVV